MWVIRGFHLIPPVLQRGIRGKRKEPTQTYSMGYSSKGIVIIYMFLLGLIFECSFAKMSGHNKYYIPCLGKILFGS